MGVMFVTGCRQSVAQVNDMIMQFRDIFGQYEMQSF